MLAGMIHFSYNRAKQGLSIYAKYCKLHQSFSHLGMDFAAVNCTDELVKTVFPIIMNKAMHLAQQLHEDANRDGELEDS